MAFLMETRVASVTRVRDALGLTDGNLARHLQRLEQSAYVATRRHLRGLRFELVVGITAKGSEALAKYVADLRRMLNAISAPSKEKQA